MTLFLTLCTALQSQGKMAEWIGVSKGLNELTITVWDCHEYRDEMRGEAVVVGSMVGGAGSGAGNAFQV